MANRRPNRPIKILLWNSNGIRREQLEFAQLLKHKKIDIALISEAKLSTNAHFHISGYNSYWNQGPTPQIDGTAVILKNNIQHTQTSINGITNIQNTAITIYTINQPITVGAIYISPRTNLTSQELDNLTQHSQSFIFGGDFNAKHTTWNSRTNNKKGKKLASHAEHSKLRPQPSAHRIRHQPTQNTLR